MGQATSMPDTESEGSSPSTTSFSCAVHTKQISVHRPVTSDSPLFKLPPEVRNMIYREVVTVINPNAHDRIYVDHGVPEPGLLLTCKQIRQESLPLYYTKNKFRLRNTDYDSTVYIHIERKNVALNRQYQVVFKASNVVTRQPNWPNLIVWLQRYHEGSVNRKFELRPTVPYRSVACAVVCMMFATVRKMRHQPWSEVAELMEGHHQVLLALDPRWA